MNDAYLALGLGDQERGRNTQQHEQGEDLKNVVEPFWQDLPHSDIFRCFTPDMLHELHKGVFGDHLLKWCISILGAEEVDRRLKCLPRHPKLRHFPRGISVISQWNGAEYREVEKVFVGVCPHTLKRDDVGCRTRRNPK